MTRQTDRADARARAKAARAKVEEMRRLGVFYRCPRCAQESAAGGRVLEGSRGDRVLAQLRLAQRAGAVELEEGDAFDPDGSLGLGVSLPCPSCGLPLRFRLAPGVPGDLLFELEAFVRVGVIQLRHVERVEEGLATGDSVSVPLPKDLQ